MVASIDDSSRLTPEDVSAAAAASCVALGVPDRIWSARAGELEWDCRRTLDHIVDATLFYATLLATRAHERRRPVRNGDGGASIPELLEAVVSAGAILAEVVRAAPDGTRAFHPAGMANASGFIGMACDEILVHTWDISCGLGVSFDADRDLCERVLRRLFPWAPAQQDPWLDLLWANGRVELPGQARLAPDWYWHCAPLEEWDGTVKKRKAPPAWR